MNLENLQKLSTLLNKASLNLLDQKEINELEDVFTQINNVEGWTLKVQTAIFGFYSCNIYYIKRKVVDEFGNINEISIVNAPFSLAVKWVISQKLNLDLNASLIKEKIDNSFDVDLF